MNCCYWTLSVVLGYILTEHVSIEFFLTVLHVCCVNLCFFSPFLLLFDNNQTFTHSHTVVKMRHIPLCPMCTSILHAANELWLSGDWRPLCPPSSFHFQRCRLIIQAESVSSEHRASFGGAKSLGKVNIWTLSECTELKRTAQRVHTRQTDIRRADEVGWCDWKSRLDKLWYAEQCCWRGGCFLLLKLWAKHRFSSTKAQQIVILKLCQRVSITAIDEMWFFFDY